MIRRICVVVFWGVLLVLAVVGAYLALFYRPEPLAEDADLTSRSPQPHVGIPRNEMVDAVEQLQRRQERVATRHPYPTPVRETGPKPRDVLRLEQERADAETVARRFYGAFARYELGALDARTLVALRATSTGAFAHELTEAPPRLTAPARRAAPGELGALTFVAGDSAAGELRTAELVGAVLRGGPRSPIAIELVADTDGWRVSGISR